jgi:N-acetylneuraminate synthase/N,N'-diacetyllegionaminate synthase|tara:strand:- start:2126 stop:3139 length:1014 start_codon:yes stop_codon:yes gene_type:complete
LKIGNIDLDNNLLVIAEIGVNHEGNYDLAELMINEVASTGAQAVKFQTFYVSENKYLSTSINEERFKRTASYEFKPEQYRKLAELAKTNGLIFLSTPFDLDSVDMLDNLCPAFKISSGDLTFYPLIEKIASKGKPVILSTGMGTEQEIAKALAIIEKNSSKPLKETVILLHCVTAYPCPPDAANLNSIQYLKKRFGLSVGYSDHTLGTTACEAAASLGVCIIEKHFTYRKGNQSFRDHELSADKNDLKLIVEQANKIRTLLGSFIERNTIEESSIIAMRRSIGAFNDLKKGDVLKREDLTFLRPASGLATDRINEIVGRQVSCDIARGSIISMEDLV